MLDGGKTKTSFSCMLGAVLTSLAFVRCRTDASLRCAALPPIRLPLHPQSGFRHFTQGAATRARTGMLERPPSLTRRASIVKRSETRPCMRVLMAQEQRLCFHTCSRAPSSSPPPPLVLLSKLFAVLGHSGSKYNVHSTFIPSSTSRRPAAVTFAASWPSHRQSRSLLAKSGPSQLSPDATLALFGTDSR